ncbi:MAG: hypothetical protein JSV51_07625 [Candidatus Bathyarchaeota archaeon]|nr:MAG: hypothetical protein JSV51_07625 [Candidatus Bathyarchaeota archaeon]
MLGYEKERLARIGYYLSLIGGLTCAFFGALLLGLLASLLYLGLLIVIVTILQRMTYKTLASILTVLFSFFYLILWWFMTSSFSMIYNIQYVGLVGSLCGLAGGALSVFANHTP